MMGAIALAGAALGLRVVDGAAALPAGDQSWPPFSGTYLSRTFPVEGNPAGGGSIEFVNDAHWSHRTGDHEIALRKGRLCSSDVGAAPECRPQRGAHAPGVWLHPKWRQVLGGAQAPWVDHPEVELLRSELAQRVRCAEVGVPDCDDPEKLVQDRWLVWHDPFDIPYRWVHLVDGKLVEGARFTKLVVDGRQVVPAQ